MQENKMGGQPQTLNTDLENQIRFIVFMLEGYQEPTGRGMLQAVKESLEKLRETPPAM
jgi:hypothetical protein